MISAKFIRKYPDAIKNILREKGLDETIVDHFLMIDKEWVEAKRRENYIKEGKSRLEAEIIKLLMGP